MPPLCSICAEAGCAFAEPRPTAGPPAQSCHIGSSTASVVTVTRRRRGSRQTNRVPSEAPRADLSLGGASRLKPVVWLTTCGLREACASFRMHEHSTFERSSDCPAVEQLLLTIGRGGILSTRAIAAGELETLLRLLGPPSERQRSDLKRATDIVLIEDSVAIYWPRTGEQFTDAA